MTCINNIYVVGNKYIGKKNIINSIISGKPIHDSFPILNNNSSIISINDQFYSYQNKKLCCFHRLFYKLMKKDKNVKIIKNAYIIVDINNTQSIHSISSWLYKLKHKYIDISNINIVIYKNNNNSIDIDILHYIIQFCTSHHLKLIQIN